MMCGPLHHKWVVWKSAVQAQELPPTGAPQGVLPEALPTAGWGQAVTGPTIRLRDPEGEDCIPGDARHVRIDRLYVQLTNAISNNGFAFLLMRVSTPSSNGYQILPVVTSFASSGNAGPVEFEIDLPYKRGEPVSLTNILTLLGAAGLTGIWYGRVSYELPSEQD